MKCKHRPIDLPEYVRGSAAPEVSAAIGAHVRSCASCSAEAEELRSLFEAMSARRLGAPPDTYWTSLLPRIHERLEERSPRVRILKGAQALLPAVVVMLLVIFLTRYDSLAPTHEAQEIHSIIHQMAGDALQEVGQSVEADVPSESGRLALSVEEPAGTDREIILALFEDGEPAPGYSELDQVQPETAVSDDEASEVVTRMQSHI